MSQYNSNEKMNLDEKIELAAQWIVESENIVIFTGAGISTHSGLPDYRGPDGVWTRRDDGRPPPKSPPWDQVKPNEGHEALKELLDIGKMDYLISQNVDGLHAKSGVPFEKLAELHGNLHFMKCLDCGVKLTFKEAGWDKGKWGSGYRTDPVYDHQPNCPECGGRLISSIVNFGDPLPEDELYEAMEWSRKADVFFVIGSSLVVSPAANMPGIAKKNGAKLIILNLGDTPYDEIADLRFFNDINKILIPIVEKVKEKVK
ncbi:MAG: putative NAD-dependent protein deacetylase 1 [Promethearchaeota archaeon]|nr:MAG: putative NAD-dependent protein deacetylase 1 [Candidatus Lokiarchaeota archaeon]